MSNIFETYFNRPAEYKVGQIWHCSEIDEDIVISDVNDLYLKMGILRGMILSRATHMDDGKDLKFKPKGELKKLYGLERILLRFTDGPVLTENLSFYKGEIPNNVTSKIPLTIKQRLNLNPVQEELSVEFFEKLQPIREMVMVKNEQFEKEMNKIKILMVLNILNKKAGRIKYRVAASDESERNRFDEFWEMEREKRNESIALLEKDGNIIRLINIDGRLYLTVKSKTFKIITDVKLRQKDIIIKAIDYEIVFGKDKMIFTSFEDELEFESDQTDLILKIDGTEHIYSFILK